MINIVFEGAPGAGKTTIINEVVKKLKKGYYSVLECNKNGIVIRRYIDN